MPSIATFPDSARGLVRVEINWADIPAVTQASVVRYNPETGECIPLRPYICYDGWELMLSCGHGIFHDTEAPLDTEFYYITTSTQAPCLPSTDYIFQDTFTRIVATDWGVATSGQTWVQTLPPGTTGSVSGGTGNISVDSADEFVIEQVTLELGAHTGYMQFFTTEVATGAPLAFEWNIFYQDANNYYWMEVTPLTTGLLTGRIGSTIGGVATFIEATIGTYAINVAINVRWQLDGELLQLKWWSDGFAEPGWLLERVQPGTANHGDFRILMGTTLGNTNAPITMRADNILIESLCAPCEPVTVDTSADPTTLDSNGTFWIKDPVRPCHDRNVPLCFTQANLAEAADGTYCIPGSGIFFASMDVESYEPNTLTLNPTNAKYPVAMSRQRRGVSTILQLVTRTFADRDALLVLADPGSPLFWQGPANYGIMDQYLDVGTLSVERGLTDHRFQVRVLNLPYVQVARPAGPSQGVCGSQVSDYCDTTWAELEADGFTWDDLIRGRGNGGTTGYRTWDDVEAGFADWNAVDNGTRTWSDLETGS